MIVKGHDFSNVSLVGIMAADTSLYVNDYTATEKTFQLLTQAAGRAGRAGLDSRVVIQTYNPTHYTIVSAANQNYEEFYKQEETFRKIAKYPPFIHILTVQLYSKQEEKLEAQQALFAAQKEHGISMLGGVGCFPILLQMPFFSAIYFAAQHTDGVAGSSFLGIELGSPSMLLVAFAGVLYYLQSILSLHGVEDEMQREQLKKMIYMSPLMIVIFSLFSPASVTLYWVVGGFMMILQQFIVNYVVRPKLRQKVREEYEKNPPKVSPSAGARKDVTPKQTQAITTNKKKKNRNSGKQRSR